LARDAGAVNGCRRLDERLGVPARGLRALVEAGRVRVDGRAILVGRPWVDDAATVEVVPAEHDPALLAERIPLVIRHHTDRVLVVDKPTGMAVTPGRGHPAGTLANALRGLGVPLSACEGPLRPGIVHRLDAGTSGLLVIAKDDVAHRALVGAFAAHAVTRVYDALVVGDPPWNEKIIDAPLGLRRAGRRAQGVRPDGKPARTRVRVCGRHGTHALVECEPETGRTHQLRVHLAHVGHPVVGDTLYGGGAGAALQARRLGIGRLGLHAGRLAIQVVGVASFDITARAPFLAR
jgi:23S rRNA pseudouridine1911/1915/1917 synthase